MSRVVAGRYAVIGPLGRGAMAEVLRARDLLTQREVALKLLKGDAARNPGARERLRREARLLSAVNHPGILRVYDFVHDGADTGLVVELLEGRGFDEALKDRAWRLRDRLHSVEKAARAVHAAHGAGMVHRDLKPANLFLEKSGRVVVMDFGLAHLDAAAAPLTAPVSQLGTPWYMSPEQASGESRDVDSRADVWALGVILYEAVAGRVPWKGRTLQEVYREILEADPPPLRAQGVRVPPGVEELCRDALAKRREDRPATALEFAERLAASRTGLGTTSQTRLPSARRLRRMFPTVAAALAATAGLIAWQVSPRRVPPAAPAPAASPRPQLTFEEQAARWYRDAQAMRDQGDDEGVARLLGRLEAAAGMESESPRGLWWQARFLRLAGDGPAAELVLRRLLKKDAGHPEARIELASLILQEWSGPSRNRFLETEPWAHLRADRYALSRYGGNDPLRAGHQAARRSEALELVQDVKHPAAPFLRAALHPEVAIEQLAALDAGSSLEKEVKWLARIRCSERQNDLNAAWKSAGRAVDDSPSSIELRLRAGEVAWALVNLEPYLSGDPTAILAEAVSILHPAANRSAYAVLLRGYLALFAWRRWDPPGSMPPSILEETAAAMRRWPGDHDLRTLLALVRGTRALFLDASDPSVEGELESALKDVDVVLSASPAHRAALLTHGYLRKQRATQRIGTKGRITEDLERAIQTYERVRQMPGYSGEASRGRAESIVTLVGTTVLRRDRLGPLLVGARNDIESVLQAAPHDLSVTRTWVEVLALQVSFGAGEVSDENLEQAIRVLEPSLNTREGLVNYQCLGMFRTALALRAGGKDRRNLLLRALQDLDRAKSRDSANWVTRAARLKVLAALDRWQEAADEARSLTTIVTVDQSLEKLVEEAIRRGDGR